MVKIIMKTMQISCPTVRTVLQQQLAWDPFLLLPCSALAHNISYTTCRPAHTAQEMPAQHSMFSGLLLPQLQQQVQQQRQAVAAGVAMAC